MSNFDFPPYRRAAYCMVGFGFDLTSRSIKVVKVLTLSRAEVCQFDFINCAEVYDLGSGSWRILHLPDMVKDVVVDDELIYSMYNKNDGLFHWRCQRRYHAYDEVVLSFDMSTELFHVTPLPDKYTEYRLDLGRWKECNFALLRDSLALIFSFFDWPYPDDEGHTTVEVWVMKDFDCMVEAGESLSSYSYSHELTLEPRLPGLCVSTGFWNKNELLIWKDVVNDEWRVGRSPFLYDIVTKQVRDVEISGELNFMYRESLVSVKGGCGNE
ncbi:hypothetical protein Vadar_026128 [Vaccinium darrowii]|uniref:Uncharacterized protein n=1 Tax=Vaccinium darrowii TaxID=229202 RepID=A0ACB7X3T3_9ERIC|nr:hypothetical protein Vadar_026128 [Vaccinium darrowii]